MGVEGIRHPRGSEPVLCRYARRRERQREGEEHERQEAQGRGRRMPPGTLDPSKSPMPPLPGAQAFAQVTPYTVGKYT